MGASLWTLSLSYVVKPLVALGNTLGNVKAMGCKRYFDDRVWGSPVNYGGTALHAAASRGDFRLVNYLAERAGANPAALKDKLGRTPIDLASRANASEHVASLIKSDPVAGKVGKDTSKVAPAPPASTPLSPVGPVAK